MKRLLFTLAVVAGVYGAVGNTLVESGTKSINATHVKMQKVGV